VGIFDVAPGIFTAIFFRDKKKNRNENKNMGVL